LAFICGPDAQFTEIGSVTGVDWKLRFSRYKYMLLRFPAAHRTKLLAWYDSKIFSDLDPSADAAQGDRGKPQVQTPEIDVLMLHIDIGVENSSLATPPVLPAPATSPTLSAPPAPAALSIIPSPPVVSASGEAVIFSFSDPITTTPETDAIGKKPTRKASKAKGRMVASVTQPAFPEIKRATGVRTRGASGAI
jgi:hypothetical protein